MRKTHAFAGDPIILICEGILLEISLQIGFSSSWYEKCVYVS